jgi:hypothetical protein
MTRNPGDMAGIGRGSGGPREHKTPQKKPKNHAIE